MYNNKLINYDRHRPYNLGSVYTRRAEPLGEYVAKYSILALSSSTNLILFASLPPLA